MCGSAGMCFEETRSGELGYGGRRGLVVALGEVEPTQGVIGHPRHLESGGAFSRGVRDALSSATSTAARSRSVPGERVLAAGPRACAARTPPRGRRGTTSQPSNSFSKRLASSGWGGERAIRADHGLFDFSHLATKVRRPGCRDGSVGSVHPGLEVTVSRIPGTGVRPEDGNRRLHYCRRIDALRLLRMKGVHDHVPQPTAPAPVHAPETLQQCLYRGRDW